MRCIAFLGTRNAAPYLRGCVAALRREGLEVHVTDNQSSDRTPAELAALQEAGEILGIDELPWDGHFNLERSLQAKHRAMSRLAPDWAVHVDADEILHAPDGGTLRDAMHRAEQAGDDVLNFDEFVFLPIEAPFRQVMDGFPALRHYYFHAPSALRLQRAWRVLPERSNVQRAGHRVDGDARIAPGNLVLRHYPFLDQAHAYRKYPARRFAPEEIARGWHRNRIGVAPDRFRFPDASSLHTLAAPDVRRLRTDEPRRCHFWAW